jgi:catechol 2,3-dioxygenase-like lactoylglutathione lyase family enzyme
VEHVFWALPHLAADPVLLPRLVATSRLQTLYQTEGITVCMPTMITGLHHVNLVVPPNTLELAREFYSDTLGLTPRPVPQLQRDRLAWFNMGTSGQQVHIAIGKPEDFEHTSSRHPCFKLGSVEDLIALRQRVWTHYERGGEAAPKEADKPGEKNSGAEGVEYPTRFFARDFAGNRLEFSV